MLYLKNDQINLICKKSNNSKYIFADSKRKIIEILQLEKNPKSTKKKDFCFISNKIYNFTFSQL